MIVSDPNHELRKLHPNEIDAIYWQYRNNGMFYIGQLGGPPISIDEWRVREKTKLAEPAK